MRFHLVAIVLAVLCAPLHAQVSASLVASEGSVQPGRAFDLALRLDHQSPWHTYWINPGTGLPTTLEWHLPEGFAAGSIQWPAPQTIRDKGGNVTGNGYDGELLLPVRITPPANWVTGKSVRLAVTAEWLMCEEYCIPGKADLALTLPVSASTPQADATWHAKIARVLSDLPRQLESWTVTAARERDNVRLTITPARETARHDAGDLHFFSEDGYIAYDLPQDMTTNEKGGYTLVLPVSSEGAANLPTKLVGVLTAKNGWMPDGSQRGMRVEAELADSKPLPMRTGGAQASDVGLLVSVGLALLGGLILNLMPCVFPVLGLKVLGFVAQSGAQRRSVVAHGLSFSAGVVLSFWALAGLLAVLRAAGADLGWGFQLQSPAFVFVLTVVMLAFGLNLSGVFEFGVRATGLGSGLQTRSGHVGSFFAGVLATVVATPCSAPFLAPALGAALALPVAQSFVVFTAIALGLSAPYLLLSIFPRAVRWLPRPGAWMETFKQLMAFPLYATVAYLVWVLAGQTSEGGLLAALWGLTLSAMAVWIYGRWNAPGASPARARFGLVAGAILLVLGMTTGWPRAAAPTDVTWEKWSPQTVAQLRAQNRYIYVDFTARWCATCQANKKLVFGSRDVLRTFSAKHVATLKADWTNRDPEITAELARFSRSAVPFNLLYIPGKSEPVELPALITPAIVLELVN